MKRLAFRVSKQVYAAVQYEQAKLRRPLSLRPARLFWLRYERGTKIARSQAALNNPAVEPDLNEFIISQRSAWPPLSAFERVLG